MEKVKSKLKTANTGSDHLAQHQFDGTDGRDQQGFDGSPASRSRTMAKAVNLSPMPIKGRHQSPHNEPQIFHVRVI